mgnify:CR=1 FL=1
MALPSSGQITLNQVNVELGLSGTAQIGLGDSAVRGLFGIASGEIEMSDGYGKSSETTLTSAGNVNGQAQRQQITVSDFISSGGTLVIPSTIWVWSDSTSTPALTIDVPCTIRNEGKIIGKGGTSAASLGSAPQAGGPAIKINSGVSSVTIQNQSGAYIAGGGGGGRTGRRSANGVYGGGGGGAGGGAGGPQNGWGGAGGALNATGANGFAYVGGDWFGRGGGSGGAGAFGNHYNQNNNGGGGGGRILPGTGGVRWQQGYDGAGGGSGGSAGAAGQKAGTDSGWVVGGGGGGGGWGAAGGLSNTGAGAAGGKAVDDSGVTYTLSNSGTIYGGT